MVESVRFLLLVDGGQFVQWALLRFCIGFCHGLIALFGALRVVRPNFTACWGSVYKLRRFLSFLFDFFKFFLRRWHHIKTGVLFMNLTFFSHLFLVEKLHVYFCLRLLSPLTISTFTSNEHGVVNKTHIFKESDISTQLALQSQFMFFKIKKVSLALD